MFTRLSKECAEDGKLILDGVFVSQYLPYAPEDYAKVYLFGLGAAQGIVEADNLNRIATLLGLEEDAVLKAYAYWEDNNLVSMHGDGDEKYVEYLPVIPPEKQIRKYSKEKFKGFNDQLHALMPNRNFLPNEYNEYYYLMDTKHIEVEAMLMIIGYCKQIKGEKINTRYILTVARNFVSEGCLTYESVSEKINEYEFQYHDLTAVLKSLKSKNKPEPEDSRLYEKWTKQYGFKSETVIQVAKKVRRGGMETLDKLLSKYYELRLSDIATIEEYEAKRKKQYEVMNQILKKLGLGYDRLDSIIENYLIKWQSLGFTDDTLVTIATYCLAANMRTLESMNGAVLGFQRKGLLSASDIDEFATLGRKIGDLLSAHGIPCTMDVSERNMFYKWKQKWNMSDEMIALAADKAAGKKYPLQYADSILAKWFDSKLTTVEDAEKASAFTSASQPTKVYSAEELEAMFKKLEDDKKLDNAANLKKKLLDTDPAFYENEKALRLANISIAKGESVDLTAITNERIKILAAHGLTEADLNPDKP